jgi:DNA-binding GntR family transcriptional regulator
MNPPPFTNSRSTLPLLGEIPKQSRRECISELLRNAIVRGELKPGQRLAESHLAKSLGVSQVSVREALQVLESEGLVIKRPNRGTFVTEFNEEELAEAVELRILLETRAGVLAHKKLQPGDEERLKEIVSLMEKLIASDRMFDLEMADLEFHATIWRIANNSPLERALRGLVYPLFAFISLTHLSELKKEPLHELGAVHNRIVQAIVTGDPKEIEEAIRNNALFGRINRYLSRSKGPLGQVE